MHSRWLKALKALIGLLVGLCITRASLATAQDDLNLHGPVTALRADGNRLLIGQGSVLIDTQITANGVQVTRAVDLKHHDVRAMAVSQGITFVLTEDGLTTLDARGTALDFAQGGGQRLAVKAGRIYIAALGAGVRMLKADPAGKLIQLGTIVTSGSAVDLACEGDSWLWVAEGENGVRLYNVRDPAVPHPLLWLSNLIPATIVRTNGLRLFIGHGSHLTILDTINVQTPRLLSVTELGVAQVSDLSIQNNRVFVGGSGMDGPDVIVLDISNVKAAARIGSFGENGAGEQLALVNDHLFVGSAQGLQRIQFQAGNAVLIAAWQTLSSSQRCSVAPPVMPQPPNLSSVTDDPVTLTWKAACNPVAYELHIDGTPAAILNTAIYKFKPQRGITTWQVTVIDAAGNRANGLPWVFESAVEGWLATPAAPTLSARLYVPPLIDQRAPGSMLAITGVACVTGLLVVISVAWIVGQRAANREERPLR